MPRYYEAHLPDLALLREHFYPFSKRADMSDAVILVPDKMDDEILEALMVLAVNLGRLLPAGNVAFKVRREQEYAPHLRAGSHFIILSVNGQKTAHPAVQQFRSPWNTGKYVLKFTAGTSAAVRQAVSRFFSPEIFNTLEGDTVFLSPTQPVMRNTTRHESVREYSYLTRIEAWLRSNWLALPIILAAASVLMFAALRLSLNQYRRGSK
jgi:hypothetical protein